jgi:hypothetical protein
MAAIAAFLSLAKDIGFVLWARRRLLSDFRPRALPIVMPIQSTLSDIIPAAGG